jgi:hypothetical protein
MKLIACFLFLLSGSLVLGQTSPVTGELLDENGLPLQSAAAVLLDPSDSTLLYFSISDSKGSFAITNVRSGKYVLQVSLLGYVTHYRSLSVPLSEGGDIGSLVMVPRTFGIEEVTITGERIPIRIRQDTIEYDAKAYKVKPDAVAEDLIRKLPGIEVDRAGNIKAMGEDVKNLLVDGKEFFGNDPKVATRNLPADAIERVQLFDRQTDESKFTGIDDGERNPSLNLVLEEKSKQGIFGDVLGGAGTDSRSQASARVYRFTQKTQFAALGMYNNINQPGFSMKDYINFSGGIQNFASGDHIMIGGENSFPVNFGQPVYGTGSNGAAGLNFSVSDKENNRFFVSWLGNGASRRLSEQSTVRNYIPDGSFLTQGERFAKKTDTAQRINFGIRKLVGSRQNLIVNGGFSYNLASDPFTETIVSSRDGSQVYEQERNMIQSVLGLAGTADASWLIKVNEGKTIFRISGRGSFSDNSSDSRFLSQTTFPGQPDQEVYNQFYDLDTRAGSYSGGASLTQRISKLSFIDVSLNAGFSADELKRRQGSIGEGMEPDPAMSPDFRKSDRFLKPGLKWKLATTKTNLTLSLGATIGEFGSVLNHGPEIPTDYSFLVPGASWEYNYRSGRRVMFDYMTSVSTPGARQLLPVPNNLNPLSVFTGNPYLKPEYMHYARVGWWLFDQFSFTTLLANASLRYTRNSIGYSRTVSGDLRQAVTPVNAGDRTAAGGLIDFSTAVRPLGIKVNLVLDESWSRGISLINSEENINNNLTHRISLIISNRKKEKWDIETGTALTLTGTRYSIQESLNDNYADISWFSEARYTPGKKLSMMLSGDITRYSAAAFSKSALVPLVNAEVSWYMLKNQRGVLTLAGVDLLNRNTGIERISELNMLTERRSSILGRYVMLSFKYRLNKMGTGQGGVDIQVKNRR